VVLNSVNLNVVLKYTYTFETQLLNCVTYAKRYPCNLFIYSRNQPGL